MRNSRYWMGQRDWFIDDAGSREATGADAGHPIPEFERQLRMGPRPDWGAGAYHLHYLADTDNVSIVGQRRPESAIFVHGSATPGQGQSTIYSGTLSSVVAKDYTTGVANQAWEATSGWTVSDVLNKRVRLTSGNSGATFYPLKDMTGSKVRASEVNSAPTFTFPFTTRGDLDSTIANGNTFVVENLTRLKQVFVGTNSFTEVNTASPTVHGGVIFESVQIGDAADPRSGGITGTPTDMIFMVGCILRQGGIRRLTTMLGQLRMYGCYMAGGGLLPMANSVDSYGCCAGPEYVGDCNFISVYGGRIRRFMTQGHDVKFNCLHADLNGGWQIEQLGAFDVSPAAIDVMSPGGVYLFNGSTIWGQNNSTAISIRPKCSIVYSGQLTMSRLRIEAANDVVLSRHSRTTSEVWDEEARSYTNPRTLSFENIIETIPNGGFCQTGSAGLPVVNDPYSGSSIIPESF